MSIPNRRISLWNELRSLGNPNNIRINQRGTSVAFLERELSLIHDPVHWATDEDLDVEPGLVDETAFDARRSLTLAPLEDPASLKVAREASLVGDQTIHVSIFENQIPPTHLCNMLSWGYAFDGGCVKEKDKTLFDDMFSHKSPSVVIQSVQIGEPSKRFQQDYPGHVPYHIVVRVDFLEPVHGVMSAELPLWNTRLITLPVFQPIPSEDPRAVPFLRRYVNRYVKKHHGAMQAILRVLYKTPLIPMEGYGSAYLIPRKLVIRRVAELHITERLDNGMGRINFALTARYASATAKFLATKWIPDLAYDATSKSVVQRSQDDFPSFAAGRCCYDLIIATFGECFRKVQARPLIPGRIFRTPMTYEGLYEWFHGRQPGPDADWGLSLERMSDFFATAGTSLYILPWTESDKMFLLRLGRRGDAHPAMFVRQAIGKSKIVPRSCFAIAQNDHLYRLTASSDTLGRLYSGTAETVDAAPRRILNGKAYAVRSIKVRDPVDTPASKVIAPLPPHLRPDTPPNLVRIVENDDDILGKIIRAGSVLGTSTAVIYIVGASVADIACVFWDQYSFCVRCRVKHLLVHSIDFVLGGVKYILKNRRYSCESADAELFWDGAFSALLAEWTPKLLPTKLVSEYSADVYYALRNWRHAGVSGTFAPIDEFHGSDIIGVDHNQMHPGTLASLRRVPAVSPSDHFEPWVGQTVNPNHLYLAEVDFVQGQTHPAALAVCAESTGPYWGFQLLWLTVRRAVVRPRYFLRISRWIKNPWFTLYPQFLAACTTMPTWVRKGVILRLTGSMQKIGFEDSSAVLHSNFDEAKQFFTRVVPVGQTGKLFAGYNASIGAYRSGFALVGSFFLAHCRVLVGRTCFQIAQAGHRLVGVHIDEIDFVSRTPGDPRPEIFGSRLAKEGSPEMAMPGFVKSVRAHSWGKEPIMNLRLKNRPRNREKFLDFGRALFDQSVDALVARQALGPGGWFDCLPTMPLPPTRRKVEFHTLADPLERDAAEYKAYFLERRIASAPVFIHGAAPGVGKTYAAVNYAVAPGTPMLAVVPNHCLEQSILSTIGPDGRHIAIQATTHCKLLGVNPITRKGESPLDLTAFTGGLIFIDEWFCAPLWLQHRLSSFVRRNQDRFFFVATGSARQNVAIGDIPVDPILAEAAMTEVFRDILCLKVLKRMAIAENPIAASSAKRYEVRKLEAIIDSRGPRPAARVKSLASVEPHIIRDLERDPKDEDKVVITSACLPPIADVEAGRASILCYTHKTKKRITDLYYPTGDWLAVGQRLVVVRDEAAWDAIATEEAEATSPDVEADEQRTPSKWRTSRRGWSYPMITGTETCKIFNNCTYIVRGIDQASGDVAMELDGVPEDNMLATNASRLIVVPGTFAEMFAWSSSKAAGVSLAMMSGDVSDADRREYADFMWPHKPSDSVVKSWFAPALSLTGHSAQGATLPGVVHVFDAWNQFVSPNWIYVCLTRGSLGKYVVHMPADQARVSVVQPEIVIAAPNGLFVAKWLDTDTSGNPILSKWRPWAGDRIPDNMEKGSPDATRYLAGRRERDARALGALVSARCFPHGRPPTNYRPKPNLKLALGEVLPGVAMADLPSYEPALPDMLQSVLAAKEAGRVVLGSPNLATALAAVQDAAVIMQDAANHHKFYAFADRAVAVDWMMVRVIHEQCSLHEWFRFDRPTYLPIDFEAEGAVLESMKGFLWLPKIREALVEAFGQGVRAGITAAHKICPTTGQLLKLSFHIQTKVVVRSVAEAKAAAGLFEAALPPQMRAGIDKQIYSVGHALRAIYSDKYDSHGWAHRPKQIVSWVGYLDVQVPDSGEVPFNAKPTTCPWVATELLGAAAPDAPSNARVVEATLESAAEAESDTSRVADSASLAAMEIAVSAGLFEEGEWKFYRTIARADETRVYLVRARGRQPKDCELCCWAHSNNNLCLIIAQSGDVYSGCARQASRGRLLGKL